MNLKKGLLVDAKYPVALEQAAEDFSVGASKLEDLEVCEEFITEKFSLARGLDNDRLDLSKPSGEDGLAISKLFEPDEDGLAISKLFEPDEDGLAISKLFEPDDDGPAISKLFEPDDDGPAIGLDDDRPDVSELSGVDGPAASDLFEDEDGLATSKLFETDDDGPARSKLLTMTH